MGFLNQQPRNYTVLSLETEWLPRGKTRFMVIFAAHIVLGRCTAVLNMVINDMEPQPTVWSRLIMAVNDASWSSGIWGSPFTLANTKTIPKDLLNCQAKTCWVTGVVWENLVTWQGRQVRFFKKKSVQVDFGFEEKFSLSILQKPSGDHRLAARIFITYFEIQCSHLASRLPAESCI